MLMDYNFTGVKKQGGFTLLPVGQYNVKIIKTEDKTSANKNEMTEIIYSVMDGSYSGVEVKDRLVYTDLTMGKVKHFLDIIGQPCDGKVTIDTSKWPDSQLRIMNEHRAYNGETYNDVTLHFKFDPNVQSEIAEVQEVAPPQADTSSSNEEVPF